MELKKIDSQMLINDIKENVQTYDYIDHEFGKCRGGDYVLLRDVVDRIKIAVGSEYIAGDIVKTIMNIGRE